jgi:hypothetical protein
MSNGIHSIGLTPVRRWEQIVSRAKLRYSFLGLDKLKYPLDLGSYGRFHLEMEREIPEKYDIPESLTYRESRKFFSERKKDYKVTISHKI